MENKEKTLYTIDQIATMLNYSKRWVQTMVKNGEIKSITMNKTDTRVSVRIPRKYLLEYLQEQNPEMKDDELSALIE